MWIWPKASLLSQKKNAYGKGLLRFRGSKCAYGVGFPCFRKNKRGYGKGLPHFQKPKCVYGIVLPFFHKHNCANGKRLPHSHKNGRSAATSDVRRRPATAGDVRGRSATSRRRTGDAETSGDVPGTSRGRPASGDVPATSRRRPGDDPATTRGVRGTSGNGRVTSARYRAAPDDGRATSRGRPLSVLVMPRGGECTRRKKFAKLTTVLIANRLFVTDSVAEKINVPAGTSRRRPGDVRGRSATSRERSGDASATSTELLNISHPKLFRRQNHF